MCFSRHVLLLGSIKESAAVSQGNTLDQNARLFAELNVALADGIIVHFDS